MLSTLQKTLGLILTGILLSTCQELIDFEPPETIKNAIFIEGKLTKGDPSTVFVKIGQVFNFVSNPSLLLAESVEILDESGQALALTSREQGIFKLNIPNNHPTFKIDYGQGYKIRLQLKNQAIYESSYDTLFQVPEMIDLKFETVSKNVIFPDGKQETQEILSFLVSTSLTTTNNSSKPHLLWEFESLFKQSDDPTAPGFGVGPCIAESDTSKICYLAINPVENYIALNTKTFSGDQLVDFSIYEADNTNTFVFSEGYYLTVYQQSLSDAAYEYWAQANLLTNRNGSIFEAPSGKIVTNFSNEDNPKDEVFGFFFATESNFKRVYVAPEDAGNPRSHCPPVGGHSVLCDNCLCWQNSTTEKPGWWVE